MSGMLNAIEAAKQMLADCYWWQNILGESSPLTQQQALDRIHIDALPPPSTGADYSLDELEALRPFAILFQDPSIGYEVESQEAGTCCAIARGLIIIQIEYSVPTNLRANASAASEDCYRKMGRILRTCDEAKPGLFDLSGTAGYLPLRKCTVHGCVRTDAASFELGDAFATEFNLYWGIE